MPVRTDRPRIFITPAILADLKAKAVPSNDRWQTLVDLVNRPGADWDVGLQNYCVAYAVTGNKLYSDKAWSLMSQSMADGIKQVTGDSGYPCRTYFPSASMVFDLCYPALTPQNRTDLRVDIETCARWVWPETNPLRVGQWAVDNPLNNYWWGFMYTWMAGLALYGDSTQAQSMIDLALTKWKTMAMPALSGVGAGGLLPEGTNYSVASASFMLQQLLAHQTATGEDIIATTPFVMDSVTAMLHLTTPSLTEMAPLGDLGAGPISDTHRRALLPLAGRDQRARFWLDQVVPNRCQQRSNSWCEFLWYPGTPAVPTEGKS